MITFKTDVNVQGVSAKQITDFMLNCTDADYQNWWPGTHLTFHTIQRVPGEVGNRVYFDEFVGKHRLKFQAVITDYVPGKKLVWQMKAGIHLPGWLVMEMADRPGGVKITHSVCIGFGGVGQVLDPLLRLYFSDQYEAALNQHAQTEFPLLGEILQNKQEVSR
jgi:uncharacterized protein YndB with AHSA1/START domain